MSLFYKLTMALSKKEKLKFFVKRGGKQIWSEESEGLTDIFTVDITKEQVHLKKEGKYLTHLLAEF